jgi:hypothetical protein
MTGMPGMYAGHRIPPGLKTQFSWDVMMSLGDQYLVTSLMESSSPNRLAERTWPGWECSMQTKFKNEERRGCLR